MGRLWQATGEKVFLAFLVSLQGIVSKRRGDEEGLLVSERGMGHCVEATQAPRLFSLCDATLSLSAELGSEGNTDKEFVGSIDNSFFLQVFCSEF